MKKITTRTTNGSKRVQTVLNGKSRTDQSFAKDCDVNVILKRFLKSKQPLPLVTGAYSDVSEVPDLDVALTQLNRAQQAFDSLPAEVRRRFGNSPVELTEFLKNKDNYEEGLKLGLLKPRTETTVSGETKRSAVVPPKNTQNKKAAKSNDDDLNDDDNN